MNVRFLLAVALFFSALGRADLLIEPENAHDFGLSFSQNANVFRITPDDIPWMDGDVLRERYELFRGHSDDEIKLFLSGQPVAHLTALQSAWDGILMEVQAEPIGQIEVTHPVHYVRGDFIQMVIQSLFGAQVIGNLDGKGSGLSPEGEAMLRAYERPLAYILGKDPFPEDFRTDFSIHHMISDLNRAIVAFRTTKAAIEAAIQKAKTEEEIRGWKHSLAQRAELPLQFAQLLRANLRRLTSGMKVTEADRKTLLQLLRSMDYTHGLFPLERGFKESMMGVAHQITFDRYNKVHGTDFKIIRPMFLVKLPVQILLANGQKQQAGILYREPHWRAYSNFDVFRSQMPSDIVGGVLRGGMQFDIFGRMVDLELPEIKLPPLSSITGFDSATGTHPIDFKATMATRAYLSGDKTAMPKLEAEIRSLASKIIIPSVPSHKPPKYPQREAQFRTVLNEVAKQSRQAPSESLVAELRELLLTTEVINERKEVLLLKIIERNLDMGSKLLMEVIDWEMQRSLDAAKRRRQTVQVDGRWLAGPIRNILFSMDPTEMMGGNSEGGVSAGRAFIRELRTRHKTLYHSLQHLSTGLFKKIFLLVGIPIDQIYEGHPLCTVCQTAVDLVLHMQESLAEETETERAEEKWDKVFSVTIQGQELSVKEFWARIGTLFGLQQAAIIVAGIMSGEVVHDRILEYLDPQDTSRIRAAHAEARAQLEAMKPQIEAMKEMQRMAESCGGQVMMVGNQPFVIISGGKRR